MSLSQWTHASPRSWAVLTLMPMWLWLSLAGGVRADATQAVLYLDGGETDGRQARERALRLELEARGILLLTAQPPATGPEAPAGPSSRETLARRTLARSEADVVLWLEGDPDRQVSWLRVIDRRTGTTEQAPLPHPPDAIEPELFAIAAASLLEQVLRGWSELGPGVEPPQDAQPQSAVAVEPPSAAAAAAALAPAESRARLQPAAAVRAAAHAPEPAAPNWFLRLNFAFSLAHVRSGMETATRPNEDQIFIVSGDRRFFDDRSPWVPDADSFDDYENTELGIPRGTTPATGNCSADGIATGPLDLQDADGDPFPQYQPSRYCARVESPGFSRVPALRVVFGRYVLPRLALGIAYQWHFDIEPASFFGNQLFGLHAEYLAFGTRGQGVTLSLLAEITAGRTETPVPSPGEAEVNALSGPLGVQGGALVRLWLASGFALVASPALGQRFPAGQLTIDLSAGGEVPF